MINFNSVCMFPALCEKCRQLVQINLFDDSPKCPKCKEGKIIAYDHTKVVGKITDIIVVDWNVGDRLGRVLKIYKGTYLCPVCDKFNLQFNNSGLCWD